MKKSKRVLSLLLFCFILLVFLLPSAALASGNPSIVYKQNSEQYKNVIYGKHAGASTVYTAVCGPFSLANLITYMTGKVIDPLEICDFAVNIGARKDNQGTYPILFTSFKSSNSEVAGYGIEFAKTLSGAGFNNIVSALQQGYGVIAHINNSDSSGGHYVAFVSYNGTDNTILMLDSFWLTARDTSSTGYTYVNSSMKTVKNSKQLSFRTDTLYLFKRCDGSSSSTSYANLGTSFYATITSQEGKQLYNNSDNSSVFGQPNNVEAGPSSSDIRYVWYFEQLNDSNHYKIISAFDNRALDVRDASNEDGANLQVYDYNGNPAQVWTLRESNGYYQISAQCTSCVIDAGGDSGQGRPINNVYLHTNCDNNYQWFRIEKTEIYTVAYNANGGTGAPASQTKIQGTALTLSSVVPTRTGYTFVGWNTDSSATSAQYQPGDSYTVDASVTLYAVWSINYYNLDLNGYLDGRIAWDIVGYGLVDIEIDGKPVESDCSDYNIAWPYGSRYEIKRIRATTGHQYDGVYSGSLSGTIGDGAVIVHLAFSTCQYTVSYDANGGTGAPESQTKLYGTDLTLSSIVPTRAGYTFLHWTDSEGVNYWPNGIYQKNAPETLTAVWGRNGTEMSAGAGRTILDGDYEIRASADRNCYLDIGGGDFPAVDGTNVQLWIRENTLEWADVWTITYLDNGFYSILQKGTNMSLTVANDSVEPCANIQVNVYEGKTSQQWSISEAYTCDTLMGFRIVSRCNGFSLDIQDGIYSLGQNIMQWESHNQGNQTWVFIPYNPPQSVEDGRYILISALSESLELDIAGDTGDIPNGQNVQVWNDNDESFATEAKSQYNSFDVTYLGEGYYKLIHAASGKALTVSEDNTVAYQNICVSDYTGSKAQQWAIVQDGDTFVLIPRCSGYSLDVQWASTEDGTNVIQYCHHTDQNGHWKFIPAEYMIRYDVCGGNETINAQLKYYKGDIQLCAEKPTRDGFLFLGWSDHKNADKGQYQPGDTLCTDGDLTLYAVWLDLSTPDCVLPASLKTIDDEAFFGCAFRFVRLPDGVESIGQYAFAESESLEYIYIPESVTDIDPDAFDKVEGLTIIGVPDSTAEDFAKQYGFSFIEG